MAGKARSVKLKSISDVNRFLSKVINMVNRDEMDSVKGAKLTYMCNNLLNGLRRQDIEDRLSKLEMMLKENGKF